MATSSASLAKPGNRENWIEKTAQASGGGGLPPGIRKVARKLKKLYPSWTLERAIRTAISRSKAWAAGGSVKGARNTSQWMALRARNKARMGSKSVAAANPAMDGVVLLLSQSWGADVAPPRTLDLAEASEAVAAWLELATPAETAEWLDLAPAVESAEGRRRAAAKGMALPGGSFPVPDVAHLRKAMKAYGRGTSPEKRAKVVALIRRAAKKLGVANEKWVTDWLTEHAGGTRKDEVAAAAPADDVAWLDLADKVTEESLRLARIRAKELGKEEKPAKGSKSKFNSAAHPRAAAGSATGGQFVPAGTARSAEGAEAQKDTTAADNSAKLQQGKVDPAKLTDEQLQKLSRYVYSWKSSDPKVVAARVKVAAALRKRGMDPGQFGSLAGKGAPPKPKPKPAAARKPAARKPAKTGTVAAATPADLVAWLDLATRYVRTQAGVKRYNRPIGSPIGTWPGGGGGRAPKVRTGADFVRSALKAKATRAQRADVAAGKLDQLSRSDRQQVLRRATPAQLAAMSDAYDRRRGGNPSGRLHESHRDVKAAQRERKGGPAAKPAADDRLAKLTPAQRDAVLAVRAKRAAQQGKPAPAPKSPDALSDAELDTALSESKVRLRAAFDKDRTRKGQEFVAAEQHATALATEKRRRNVAAGAKPGPLSPAERSRARLAEQEKHAAEAAQRRAATTPKLQQDREASQRRKADVQAAVAAERAEDARRDRELSVDRDRTDAELDALSEADLERLQNRLLTTATVLPNSDWEQRRRMQKQADRAEAARARKQQGATVTNLADRRAAERPQPDMSNVDKLSNTELTSRLAAAQTRLREAKQADPRRSTQGYADAKLARDVLAAEQRRRDNGRTAALDIGAAINARQQAAAPVRKASDPAGKPADEVYTGAHVEDYGGHKLRLTRDKTRGTMTVTVDGNPVGSVIGRTNADGARELRSARAYVDDSKQRPDAYTWSRGQTMASQTPATNPRAVSGTPENIAARQQARARGASQPSMFAGEEEQKLSDVAVRRQAAGTLFEEEPNDEAAAIAEMAPRRTASVRAAEAEAQRARERLQQAEAKVERAVGASSGPNDPNLPLGQIVNRTPRQQQRAGARADADIARTAAAFREREAAERDARVKEAKAHREARDAETIRDVTPETLRSARFIRDKSGSWHQVKKVNAKSVTVPSVVGGSWDDRIPIDKIVEVRA